MFIEINGIYYNRNAIKQVYKSICLTKEFCICVVFVDNEYKEFVFNSIDERDEAFKDILNGKNKFINVL